MRRPGGGPDASYANTHLKRSSPLGRVCQHAVRPAIFGARSEGGKAFAGGLGRQRRRLKKSLHSPGPALDIMGRGAAAPPTLFLEMIMKKLVLASVVLLALAGCHKAPQSSTSAKTAQPSTTSTGNAATTTAAPSSTKTPSAGSAATTTKSSGMGSKSSTTTKKSASSQ